MVTQGGIIVTQSIRSPKGGRIDFCDQRATRFPVTDHLCEEGDMGEGGDLLNAEGVNYL